MKQKKRSLEFRLDSKPLGELVDIAIKLTKSSSIKLNKIEKLNDMFGIYSVTAQRAVLIGFLKRRLTGRTNRVFACDKIMLGHIRRPKQSNESRLEQQELAFNNEF